MKPLDIPETQDFLDTQVTSSHNIFFYIFYNFSE